MRSLSAAILWFVIAISVSCVAVSPPRIVRIGTTHSPDLNYFNAAGRPTGFGVDVMNAAAVRAGIKLQWVPLAVGTDESFATGLKYIDQSDTALFSWLNTIRLRNERVSVTA